MNDELIGKQVRRIEDGMIGYISSYYKQYKACITVSWADNSSTGWYDRQGTDGKVKVFEYV